MSAYLDNLYSALRTVINQAWPDVTPDGIYEADHLDMMPVEDLTPPYAVISITSLPKTDEWAVDTLDYLPLVDIYVVENVSGPRSPIRAKLEALRDLLWSTPMTYGQVMDIPLLDWSQGIDINRLLASKSLTQRAGRVQVSILMGESLSQGPSQGPSQ